MVLISIEREVFFVNMRQGERRLVNSSVTREEESDGVLLKGGTKECRMSNEYLKKLENTLVDDLEFIKNHKELCARLENEWLEKEWQEWQKPPYSWEESFKIVMQEVQKRNKERSIPIKPTYIKPDWYYEEVSKSRSIDDNPVVLANDIEENKDMDIESEEHSQIMYNELDQPVITDDKTIRIIRLKELKRAKVQVNNLLLISVILMDSAYKLDKEHNETMKSCHGELKVMKKAIDQGYLIDRISIEVMKDIITESIISHLKEGKVETVFKFPYTPTDIMEIVKREARWRDKERDIAIYKERQEGKLLEEIGVKWNLKYNSISGIIDKVQGLINKVKGRLFEQAYNLHLKTKYNTNDYKVEWLGAKGQPDILIHDLSNDTLYVYSLKNLRIDKKPFYIAKTKLQSEYKHAFENQFTYKKVRLILVVFNNVDNTLIENELDFLNPTDIIIK